VFCSGLFLSEVKSILEKKEKMGTKEKIKNGDRLFLQLSIWNASVVSERSVVCKSAGLEPAYITD